MEITGKVIKILDAQSFISQRTGDTYVKNQFVIETQGQYPKKVAFTVMGEEKFKAMNIVVGGNYNISFDVESREWKEKWFTEASAWKAVSMDGQQAPAQQPAAAVSTTATTQTAVPQQAAPAPQPQQQADGGGADDLPF